MSAEEVPNIEEVDVAGSEESTESAVGTRVLRIPLGALLWAAAVVASFVLLVVLGFTLGWPWPLQPKDQTAEQSAIDAAKDGTVAVYTYSADTIDRDIASAQSHLTGDFFRSTSNTCGVQAPTEPRRMR